MTAVRRTIYILLAVISLTMALTACDKAVVHDEFKPTPIEGWEKNDTMVYAVKRLARGGVYRQEVGLRITREFPFTGVSLLVERIVEPGHKVFADTLNCRLYDEEGNVKGRGVSLFQYNFILSDVEMQKGDSLNVRIRHLMKREILPGISDIGFRLEAR